MKNAIFWDFHNTLVYTKTPRMWTSALREALAAQGITPERDVLLRHVMTCCPWDAPDEDWRATVGAAFWPYVFTRFDALYREAGFTGDTAPLNAAVRATIIAPASYALFDDTISTLKACKSLGYNNHVLSNNYPELEQVVAALGLREFFGEVITSGIVGYDKPRRELFDHARALAGDPAVIYMVGDSPTADVGGGNAAGMTSILVHNEADCGASFTCATLAEIPQILQATQQYPLQIHD